MHPALADHLNPGCVDLANMLMTCHAENRWSKFLGKCNAISEALNKCLGDEFEVRRKQQLIEARARRAKIEEKWQALDRDDKAQGDFERMMDEKN